MTNTTQCPNCSSIFAISDEQYSASKGNVRCGACREKFNVEFLPNSDNLVLNTSILSNQISEDQTNSPYEQSELLRILSEHAQLEVNEAVDNDSSNEQLKSPTQSDFIHEPSLDNKDSELPLDLFANSFSENLSITSDTGLPNPDQSTHTITLSDDDLLSDELLDEVDNLIGTKVIGNAINYADLQDEPTELFSIKPSWPKRIKMATGLLALVLVGVVLLSGLTYQLWLKQVLPESLISPVSAIAPLINPIVEKVTQQYDLTLPIRTDLNNLQLVSAHTQAHPTRASTILLRVSFLNKAKIKQPLPNLELSLTDENGRIVSRRSFSPLDYLYNNATDNLISSNELKKVTIELLAFPKQAHGYELKMVN